MILGMKYWPVAVFILTAAAGYGANQVEIRKVSDVVVQQAQHQTKIENIRVEQSAMKVQLDMMQKMLERIDKKVGQ